jgi:hypothetical protein
VDEKENVAYIFILTLCPQLTPFSACAKLIARLVTGNAGKTTMGMILLFLFWFCPFLCLKKNQVGPL